ncbi:hypothetical protein [Phytomonospora endophytica]|uniref:Uncharacterized protein n=1 Tax=Phytomonospora endophytica TaxID=714109 RepID=A0A841FD70_9ACTN|nr:hypothetical protein [Phytomonospora endophytica]MBB6034226.1 hypothetical protein [Phytomonospora endophytica]GIG66619.1 hypothetical protein Pen01_29140 [Phytomonospora endophytica]
MSTRSGAVNVTAAVVTPIIVVICCIGVMSRGGKTEEPIATADPAEVAARLVVRLDTATAELDLPMDALVAHTGFCDAPNFEVPPKDRYVVVTGYRYTPGVSAQNDHIIALYERWGELGWQAEIDFDSYTGMADTEASDAGDGFSAFTDWRELTVSVTSPCYLFEGEPVWGEITPAPAL